MNDFFENGIGDLFISNERKKQNESALKDAELQRQQTEELISYMGSRKAMASGDTNTDKQKYIILGGVAFVMIFAIIMIT
jgi:hypothetical protein